MLKRDGFRCQYCGRSGDEDAGVFLQVDHIIPKSKGGGDEYGNLLTACRDCNIGKAARMIDGTTSAESPIKEITHAAIWLIHALRPVANRQMPTDLQFEIIYGAMVELENAALQHGEVERDGPGSPNWSDTMLGVIDEFLITQRTRRSLE